MNIRNFLVYNNAVPITLGVLFLGSGVVFAASEEVRDTVSDAVYSSDQQIVTVDNTYIANKNLAMFKPQIRIVNVTEDQDNYYIEYTFSTIDIRNYVWQDVVQNKTMEVAKSSLGQYDDLGVYVTEQLRQLAEREVAYLTEVQEKERQNVTSKVVATQYGGLIGQFIDDTTETLPGYTPLVVAPPEPDPPVVTSGTNEGTENTNNNEQGSSGAGSLVLSVLGANPARIALNASYSDLGVVVTDDGGASIGHVLTTFVNGQEVANVSVDTDEVSTWIVRYEASTQEGATGFVERRVEVYDPNAPVEEEETTTETATTTEEGGGTTEETNEETNGEETATTTEETTEETGEGTATTTEETTEETNSEEEQNTTATTTEETTEQTSEETTTTEETTETTTEETTATTTTEQTETATSTETTSE